MTKEKIGDEKATCPVCGKKVSKVRLGLPNSSPLVWKHCDTFFYPEEIERKGS